MALTEAKPPSQVNATGNKRRKKKSRKEKQEADEARRLRLLDQLGGESAEQLPSNVKIEYVEQQVPNVENTQFAAYSDVFAQFASNAARSFGADVDEDAEAEAADGHIEVGARDDIVESRPGDDLSSDDGSDMDDSDDDRHGGSGGLSRKQKKKSRMSVAELKQLAPRPEVVEWTDTSARDPELLVALKAAPNTVPVPVHWSQKKKYLQYKRGMEKPPFELPDFIRATGIMEMREAVKEKEDEKKTKATARERMRPKMNKLTLDYQRLHDAFFKFQTPPKNLTGHGDLFYEGKESDVTYNFTPGILSDSLKTALNIPPLAPPPWLINMQRYGPPPSYPSLVVPGLNAPIPPGAQWGYHPGGWGRPPVDELGRPLYGDVFAAGGEAAEALLQAASMQVSGPRKYWGDLEIVESSDEEEEDEEESEAEGEAMAAVEANDAAVEPAASEHITAAELTDEQLRSGMASIPSGLETPSVLQLRKQPAAEPSGANKSLYTILPEREAAQLEGIMGSQFTYEMGKRAKSSGKGVEIALDASELDSLDADALRARYDEAAEARAHAGAPEDLSDMVAEHAATQARKRKPAASTSAPKKKAKDFKF
ncbi:hypothetical protein H4S01_001318 [Coemansia sp. RSA 2610]|nr:hypothetical protein H4S01_001318 [Coemansia sp. RSA 2610]